MFDFHSAFLNGQLDEDKQVFMEQLPDYEKSNQQKYCIKLYMLIYTSWMQMVRDCMLYARRFGM